jgi:hypothetical protein
MLYFSKYVDDSAEQLRSAFVQHEGKKELTVVTDNTDETDWSEFMDKVIVEIKKNTVEDVTSKLECDFSSTNKFSKFMSTAIIMNSFKTYFDYTNVMAGCGILKIHMAGRLEDW